MNDYLSKKIKFLSFFAMIGVVYCHAYNYFDRFLQSRTVLSEGANPGAMLQFFIINGLVRFAVPLFFIFSGYLFFVHFEFTWKGYLQKVLKRVRTLVVPFLIWTALAGTFLYIVYRFVGLERYSIVYEKVGTMLDKEKYKNVTKVITILWVAGCFCYALCSGTMGKAAYVSYLLLALYKINVITGLASMWRLYDINAGKWQDKKWVKAIVSCTVIVFVVHEPLQHLLTDVLLEKMTFNGAHTLIYFVLPIVMILSCAGLGILLKKVCPKVYGVLTGGRGWL